MAINAEVTVTTETNLPGGEKLIRGFVAVYTVPYDQTSTNVNLTNHFKSTTYPTVVIGPSNGYTCYHNAGTAAGGLIKIMATGNGANAVAGLTEITNGTNVATNSHFYAIGQAY